MILKKYRKGNQIYALLKCDNCHQEVEVILHMRGPGRRGGMNKSRFCSKKCSGSYYNIKRLFYRKCLFCKNDFKVNISERKKAKFCSKSCFFAYKARKTQDIIGSIKLLQSQGIPYKEMAIRMRISYYNLKRYVTKYRLSLDSDRLKRIKALKGKWLDSEIAILMEHIEKSQKCDSGSELVSKLNRSRSSIKVKLWRLRKKLAGA